MIHVGCSGWNYKDWIGKLYPIRTRDMLYEYSKVFDTVEINTTFYRVPPAEYVENWIKKTSSSNVFTFSLKFPREVTHELLFRNLNAAREIAINFQEQIITRLKKKNKLGYVLLQLPPYFSTSNLPYLYRLMGDMDTHNIQYFVEVRNRDLYENKAMARSLEEMNAGVVDIDSPEKKIEKVESILDVAYLRFHGQNYDSWSKRNGDPSERYNYLYSGPELNALSNIVKEKLDAYKEIFIYFNNHPGGFAPSNASSFRGLLGIEPSNKQNQQTLF